jgi:anti-sigma-K factor RskA
MTRVGINSRGDLDKPLVEADENAPVWERIVAWVLRSYLILAAITALLAGVVAVIFVLTL